MTTNANNKDEVLQSLLQTAAIAAQQFELTCPEQLPCPLTELFERLAVCLERRRSALIQEVSARRRGRESLEEALVAASWAKCRMSVRDLCSAEAELDAAIGDAVVLEGFWECQNVDKVANDLEELFEAIHDRWLLGEEDGFIVNINDLNSCTSSIRIPDCLGDKAEGCSGDQKATPSAANITCEDPLVASISRIQLSELGQISSVTFCWKKYFCIQRSRILIRNLDGSVSHDEPGDTYSVGLFSDTSGNFIDKYPVKVRACNTPHFERLIVMYNDRIVLTSSNDIAELHIGPKFSHSGRQLSVPEDVVHADKFIVIASPSYGLYVVSLVQLKSRFSRSNKLLNIACPLRLAWDSNCECVIVLDKVGSGKFKVCKFSIKVASNQDMTISLDRIGNDSHLFESGSTPSMIALSGKILLCTTTAGSWASVCLSILDAHTLKQCWSETLFRESNSQSYSNIVDLCWLGNGSLAFCRNNGSIDVLPGVPECFLTGS